MFTIVSFQDLFLKEMKRTSALHHHDGYDGKNIHSGTSEDVNGYLNEIQREYHF